MKNINLNFNECSSPIRDVSYRDVVIIGECKLSAESELFSRTHGSANRDCDRGFALC